MDAHFSHAVRGRRRGFFDPLSDLFPPLHPTTATSSSIEPLPTSSATTSATTTTTSSLTSDSTTASTTSTTSTTSASTAPSISSSSVQETITITPSSFVTVTQIPTVATSSDVASPTAVADTQPKSFLQNKVLSGVVFALVGVVALVLLVSAATFALRRSQKKRLLNEALSFDPIDVGSKDMMIEVGQRPAPDRSSSSTGHTLHGNEPLVTPANTFNPGYAPPMYASAMQPYALVPAQVNVSTTSLTHQPYAQRFNWSGAPAQESRGYDSGSAQPGASQEGPYRRSQSSSSGDFQFAAVTPPPGVSGVRR